MRAEIGEEGDLGPGTLLLMIGAACLLLANLYYPQPILGEVARALRLPEAASGAVITAGQLGYIFGLLLVAPLGDMRENRRLCAAMTAEAGLCALAAAGTGSAPLFLLLMVVMGVFATATQVLVVFATALAGPGRSGKILGIMACGLFLGIALSRPVASLVAGLAGWRAVYLGSGLALLATGLCLYRFLPSRPPAQGRLGWRALVASLWPLLRFPLLLRRTLLSCGAFFSFSMFWSTVPLSLAVDLNMARSRITAFALAGLVTPPCMLLVGRLLDKGRGRQILLGALGCAFIAWALLVGAPAWLGVFVASSLMLDPSSSAITVSIQQKILSGAPEEVRGRLNSLNIIMNFLGGAAGAALGPWLLTRCGLAAVALSGALLLACLFCCALKWRRRTGLDQPDFTGALGRQRAPRRQSGQPQLTSAVNRFHRPRHGQKRDDSAPLAERIIQAAVFFLPYIVDTMPRFMSDNKNGTLSLQTKPLIFLKKKISYSSRRFLSAGRYMSLPLRQRAVYLSKQPDRRHTKTYQNDKRIF